MSTSALTSVRLHGWSVATELPIVAARSDSPADITMRLDPAELDRSRSYGRTVLDQRPTWDSRLVRAGDGFRYRVDDDYEVAINSAVDDLTVAVGAGRPLDALGLVLAGGVLAIASTLRGRSCLHATTVAIGDRAIAVIGPVGAGKTTTAGLLMSVGATLIGEDVLAPMVADGVIVAPRGLLELRLRESAAALSEDIPADRVRKTVDGRFGVVPARVSQHDRTPIACFVRPRLVAGTVGVTVRELSAGEAFRELTASPRLEGWRDAAIVEQEFDLVARLANAVPVIEVTVAGTDSLSRASAYSVREAIEPYLGTGISSDRAS
ncbi:MAG: hypothetical protein AB7Q42_00525 [Acidimicrobiia bacterium]